MEAVLLSIHLIVAIALVATILLQRSEGGALGLGGGAAGGLMTARGAGDALSRMTKWLAIVFLLNSLALGWIASHRKGEEAIFEKAVEKPAVEQPADDGKDALPEIPTIPSEGEG